MFFDPATKFLCLSSRIVCALPEKFQIQAQSAPRPTEASLLSLLDSQPRAISEKWKPVFR